MVFYWLLTMMHALCYLGWKCLHLPLLLSGHHNHTEPALWNLVAVFWCSQTVTTTAQRHWCEVCLLSSTVLWLPERHTSNTVKYICCPLGLSDRHNYHTTPALSILWFIVFLAQWCAWRGTYGWNETRVGWGRSRSLCVIRLMTSEGFPIIRKC